MATAAAIAAAAIGAAGAIGGSVISSQASKSAARAGKPDPHRIPLPPYAGAMNHYMARTLAANIDKVPPSFSDYLNSGGTAKFPFEDPGFTSVEAKKLGLIDKGGQPVPTLTAADAQNGLNDDQQDFLARWMFAHGKVNSPLYNMGRLSTRIANLEARGAGGPARDAKISRLSEKLSKRRSAL
jgi:hypothetical protein